MSPQDPYITQLYQKFLEGKYNADDLQQLLSHFEQSGAASPLLEDIRRELETPRIQEKHIQQRSDKIVADVDRVMLGGTQEQETLKLRKPVRFARLAVAAVLAALFVAGIAYVYKSRSRMAATEMVSRFGGDVLPGGNKAVLVLSNGRRYELDDAQTGIVVGKDRITYQNGNAVADVTAPEATIATPNGGQYNLTLPDGTKVWLNAGSTVTYPLSFTGAQRKVTLNGEAYFSVTHDAQHPFVVSTKGQDVQVLGTEFDLRAYGGETIHTTLVKGRVQVSLNGSPKTFVLSPGQQLSVSNQNGSLREVNTEAYTAWKDGLFAFHDLPLTEALAQLEQWYDIELPADVPNVKVYAEISRNTKLSEVLNLLEAGTGLHFEIKERRLLIRK